jgi:hypothetical protein
MWFTPVIPALKRLRQEDHEFEASLGYIGDRYPVSKPKQNKKQKKNVKARVVKLIN